MRPRPQPAWMAHLRVGDVLKNAKGTYRIVRHVSYLRGRLWAVSFTIKHRSWTRRCYTVLMYQDLVSGGYQPVGARIKLTSELDKKIEASLHTLQHILTWRDVQGVA